MYRFHRSNDILLMTSAWEGFPLVIMEAMAFGAIPLVSNIDAIPEHIRHGENGFLLQHVDKEDQLADEAVEAIRMLIEKKANLRKISLAGYHYAQQHFDGKQFERSYRAIMGLE